MPDHKPHTLTDDEFEAQVLNADGISVVDFWSPRCGPCHQMAPALDAFSESNAGRVKVFKLDVDDNPKTAERYEIRSVPTVIYFKDGLAMATHRGAMSQVALQSTLEDLSKD